MIDLVIEGGERKGDNPSFCNTATASILARPQKGSFFHMELGQVKYPSNLVEQDHRFIKLFLLLCLIDSFIWW
jgi:hypothetical protein